jgi:hypothetical protein
VIGARLQRFGTKAEAGAALAKAGGEATYILPPASATGAGGFMQRATWEPTAMELVIDPGPTRVGLSCETWPRLRPGLFSIDRNGLAPTLWGLGEPANDQPPLFLRIFLISDPTMFMMPVLVATQRHAEPYPPVDPKMRSCVMPARTQSSPARMRTRRLNASS